MNLFRDDFVIIFLFTPIHCNRYCQKELPKKKKKKDQMPFDNNIAGAPLSTEDKVLETAASATQVKKPIAESSI